MKKFSSLILSATIFAAGCICTDEVKHTAKNEYVLREEMSSSKIFIENEFLKVSLLPELSGGVENVVLKSSSLPLLRGGAYILYSQGPLFVHPTASGVLYNEKFWNHSNPGLTRMQTRIKTDSKVSFYASTYDIQPAALQRDITVLPDSTIIRFDVVYTPHAGTKYITKGRIQPWLNLLASLEINWKAVIPGKGGLQVNGLGQKTDFPKTGIYRKGTFGPNTFFTPARNWVAVTSEEKQLSLALIHDQAKTCTIYSWQGLHENRFARTIEFIFPDSAENANDVRKYSYKMAVFNGIGNLQDIVQDTAIESRRENGKLIIRFSSARNVKAQKLAVSSKINGKTTALKGTDKLPALKTGKVVEAVYELPETLAKGELTVTWGEESFTLLEEVK